MSKEFIMEQFYTISIAGKRLNDKDLALVTHVSLVVNSTGSDILTITVSDPDFKYIGSESLFIEDNSVKFTGGWRGVTPVKFDGYISVIDVNFPPTGSPSITINCMDNTYLMNRRSKSRTWKNRKESYAVNQIFKEYGFKAHVHTTKLTEETITQSNKTDIEFLIELAEKQEEEYIVYVEGNDAYFVRKPKLGTPQTTLWYGEGTRDIQSFNPRINKERKKEEVVKKNVDVKNKKAQSVTVKKSQATQGKPVKTSSSKRK